jgi:hypothetical protein
MKFVLRCLILASDNTFAVLNIYAIFFSTGTDLSHDVDLTQYV